MRRERIRTSAICACCGGEYFPFRNSDYRSSGGYCSNVCRNLGRYGTPEDRFWRQVVKGEDTECWLWTGRLMSNGYGVMTVRKRYVGVHRFSFALVYGPIPEGMHVCHNCPGGDVRNCVNPAHLWLGTQADNNADMHDKGRYAIGERHGQARLDAAQVRAIRARHAVGGITQRAIAREYGVLPGHVSEIVTRKIWRHVD